MCLGKTSIGLNPAVYGPRWTIGKSCKLSAQGLERRSRALCPGGGLCSDLLLIIIVTTLIDILDIAILLRIDYGFHPW